jgi:hypothetical protein
LLVGRRRRRMMLRLAFVECDSVLMCFTRGYETRDTLMFDQFG